jgi:hypothetical protein
MLLSTWVHQFQDQLRGISQLGDATTQRTTEHLIATSTPLLRLALTDAVGELVAEHNARSEQSIVLAMQGDDVSLGLGDEPKGVEFNISGEKNARIALRLSEELKLAIDSAAAEAGISTNTWIINTLQQKIVSRPSRPGNRLRGTGRA